ncbi:MAG: U32 family peptidase [Chitinispirillaceae bacterium]
MELSVAYTFEPGLISRLAEYPQVSEIYGKLHSDSFGGGRWSATLRSTSPSSLSFAINQAHHHGIKFNYLLNCADLYGLEHTRSGQRKIRRFLDYLSGEEVDSVTVAVPYLLKLIKEKYPHFKVRIGVFAGIADEVTAKRWENLGADTLTVSSIACNRNFKLLARIREAVNYSKLQLIVNASCITSCIHEQTHMHMLSRGSRSDDPQKGFMLDYCFLNCSSKKLLNPRELLHSCWIRPEDLRIYENLGYHHFKIVERSCPADLLVRRVKAYAQRSYSGNLLGIVGPVAHITASQKAPLDVRLRLAFSMLRPGNVKMSTVMKMNEYINEVIPGDHSKAGAPVYMDNKKLDGYVEKIRKKGCTVTSCTGCGYCAQIAEKAITLKDDYRDRIRVLADTLDRGMVSGSHWF